jgi:hypothetical protein
MKFTVAPVRPINVSWVSIEELILFLVHSMHLVEIHTVACRLKLGMLTVAVLLQLVYCLME